MPQLNATGIREHINDDSLVEAPQSFLAGFEPGGVDNAGKKWARAIDFYRNPFNIGTEATSANTDVIQVGVLAPGDVPMAIKLRTSPDSGGGELNVPDGRIQFRFQYNFGQTTVGTTTATRRDIVHLMDVGSSNNVQETDSANYDLNELNGTKRRAWIPSPYQETDGDGLNEPYVINNGRILEMRLAIAAGAANSTDYIIDSGVLFVELHLI